MASIQRMIEDFRKLTPYGLKWKLPAVRDTWLFVVTEVAEIGDALIRSGYALGDDYFRMNERAPDIEMEIGDALVMLCTLASQLDVDIEVAVQKTLDKIAEKVKSCVPG